MNLIKYFPVGCIVVVLAHAPMSCTKFADAGNPPTTFASATVFHSAASATAAVTGIYGRMISSSGNFASGNNHSISYLAALSADELSDVTGIAENRQFNENSLRHDNKYLQNYLWSEVYQYIYSANSIIENLQLSHALETSLAGQLEGECLFIRAFCHFYLVNLYGPVPLITTTDFRKNAVSNRTDPKIVYAQIIRDLEKAAVLISPEYLGASGTNDRIRIRPNRYAVLALLSRLYLYTGRWTKAVQTASLIINNPTYQLESLDRTFLKDSREAIWQLKGTTPGINTWEAFVFLQPVVASQAVLTASLINDMEASDERGTSWMHYNSNALHPYAYPAKYKAGAELYEKEYSVVLRLAEQFLIRSEAEARAGHLQAAIADLDIIRERAGLSAYSGGATGTAILSAIIHERRIELFTEWGHRWFDLRRSHSADMVLSVQKGDTWRAADTLYPIPLQELEKNPALYQNPGY